jgi:hypothetical protein
LKSICFDYCGELWHIDKYIIVKGSHPKLKWLC